MAYKFQVTITDGSGVANAAAGNYTGSITSDTAGYKTGSTLNNFTITQGVTAVTLQIVASGSYTLHVTEEGTAEGTAVADSTFIRCDSTGETTYGSEITTDASGNATFTGIPWDTESEVDFYFKQTGAVGHEFDDAVYTQYINASTGTQQIENAISESHTFSLTDSITGDEVATGVINATT